MSDAAEVRASQRAAWAGLASGWEKWDAIIVDQLAPVGSAMADRLATVAGGRHLDVATGTGEPGLTIARRSPTAHVVLTDLAPEMLAIAMRRAAAQGIANVEAHACSADDLPFEDGSFDTASVRFGFMFFPDLGRATAEIARVLRPGGRVCSSVWVEPDANPWTAIAVEAIATEAPVPPPDPDRPHMFGCATPGHVRSLFEAAELRDVVEWDVPVELVTESPEQYWAMISEHVSLAVAALRHLDAPARARVRTIALDRVRAFERGGEIRVPGLARCTIGTKP